MKYILICLSMLFLTSFSFAEEKSSIKLIDCITVPVNNIDENYRIRIVQYGEDKFMIIERTYCRIGIGYNSITTNVIKVSDKQKKTEKEKEKELIIFKK